MTSTLRMTRPPPTSGGRRVFIIDDSAETRAAVKDLLEQRDFEFVGEAEDAEGLLVDLQRLNPDIVILDWLLPGANADLIGFALRAMFPVRLLLLSGVAEHRPKWADAWVHKADFHRLIPELEALAAPAV